MKYKVGDKVIVREWDDMEKEFGLDSDGDIKAKCCFVRSMREHCGKEMIIKRDRGNGLFNMVGTDFNFSEDTFEKKHLQKIVITTDGVETLARLYDGDKVVKRAIAKCSPNDTFDFNVGAKLAFERLTKDEEKKPLTFREKLKQEHPEKLNPKYGGGCHGCPHNYGYEGKESRPCKEHSASCTECWDRAIPEDKAKKKKEDPPKYYNGKAVCIETEPHWAYTVGKVYEFKDGLTTINNGCTVYRNEPVKSIDEWNKLHGSFAKMLAIVE